METTLKKFPAAALAESVALIYSLSQVRASPDEKRKLLTEILKLLLKASAATSGHNLQEICDTVGASLMQRILLHQNESGTTIASVRERLQAASGFLEGKKTPPNGGGKSKPSEMRSP